MSEIWDSIKTLLDPGTIITYGGLLLVCIVVFIENGVFFGFFLAGDNLILLTGMLTATGVIHQPIVAVEIALMLSAILGYWFGYWFGKRAGSALKSRPDTFFFRKSHIQAAEDFYKRYGGSTLIIGRFLWIIRTFAPIVAGTISMPFRTFMLYNVIGSILWIASFCTVGYIFGKQFEEYMGYIIIGLIMVTAIPIVRVAIKNRRNKTR